MGDYYKNPYEPTSYSNRYANNLYGNRYAPQQPSGGLTEAQKELLPYLKAEKEKKQKEQGFLPFLELVLDILQRGQYVTANIGEDIARGKSVEDILTGAGQGLLGTRKGDWTTTLFGGQDVGEEDKFQGIFPNAQWAEQDLPLIPGKIRDAVGLLANVILDPTTYLGFGATKAAKAGAEDLALKTVKNAFRNNIDEFTEAIAKGFSKNKFSELLEKNADDAIKYLTNFTNANTVARFRNKAYKKAYNEILRSTPEKIQQHFLEQAVGSQSRYLEKISGDLAEKGVGYLKKTIKSIVKQHPELEQKLARYSSMITDSMSPDSINKIYKEIFQTGVESGIQPKGFLGNIVGELGRYGSDISHIGSKEFLEQYKHVGERGARFMGQEFAKGIRQPNIVSRSFQTFKDKVKDSPIGSLANAISAKLDDGVVGTLRRMFGFRNAYQKALNAQKANISHHFFYYFSQAGDKANSILEKFDDETLAVARDVIGYNQFNNLSDLSAFFEKPELWGKLPGELTEKNAAQVKDAVLSIKSIFDGMYKQEQELVAKGFLPNYGYMANYLPTVNQNKLAPRPSKAVGPYRKGFTRTKDIMQPEHMREEIAVFKMMLGVDDDVAKKMVLEKNWSSVNMDMKEMIYNRMFAHAQAMANADLVDAFKEFGITFGDLVPGKKLDPFADFSQVAAKDDWYLFQALKRRNRWIQTGDIRKISTEFPILQDMYFDRDVADILDKVMQTTGSDQGLKQFQQIASGITSWWKAFATLSPGFHLRNMKSNMFTLFMKEGFSAFNPKKMLDALACGVYGLHGEAGLAKLPFGKAMADRIMNKRIGGKSLKEWTDQVLVKEGVITKATMAFDIEKATAGKGASLGQKLNPFDIENFALFKGSHEIASVVESHARIMSFFSDIEKMAGPDVATDYMANYAVKEAKKWFLDYNDLTDFEKKYMKNLIPFYTWLRKNVARQVTQMVENKEMYSIIPKTIKAASDKNVNAENLPEYMREEMYIPLGPGEEPGTERVFHPDLPYEDLNIIPFKFEVNAQGAPMPIWSPEETWNEFMSAANPIIKTVFTTLPGPGYDPFRRRDLESKSPAPRALRILGTSPQVMQIADSIARIVIPGGLGLEKDDKGKLIMNGKIAKVLEDNFLVLKRLEQLGDTVSTIFPQVEKLMEEFTQTKDIDDLDKLFKTLSFGLGITIRDYNQDQEDERKFRKMLDEAEKMRKENRSNIPGYRKRSETYRKSQEQRMRKLRSAVH
jgi:hypothetical protein